MESTQGVCTCFPEAFTRLRAHCLLQQCLQEGGPLQLLQSQASIFFKRCGVETDK